MSLIYFIGTHFDLTSSKSHRINWSDKFACSWPKRSRKDEKVYFLCWVSRKLSRLRYHLQWFLMIYNLSYANILKIPGFNPTMEWKSFLWNFKNLTYISLNFGNYIFNQVLIPLNQRSNNLPCSQKLFDMSSPYFSHFYFQASFSLQNFFNFRKILYFY